MSDGAKHRKAAQQAEAATRRAREELAEARKRAQAADRELDALRAKVNVLTDERSAALRRSKVFEAELATARRDLSIARQAALQAETELLAERAATQASAMSTVVEPAPTASSAKRTRTRAKSPARRAPALAPGLFDGQPQADRHLIGDATNLLVVDGYNVARHAWSSLAPEQERTRVVALLDEVQARSGGRVVVVFDGDDGVVAPGASKTVTVRFSASGQTADDAIVALLAATPSTQPVVVVSSDRAVVADARRQGAVAMSASAFLGAAGR